MKKQYIAPALKVVAFRTERGFADSAFNRALAWLNTHSITSRDTHPYAVAALRSAAYTYFMAALSSIATLLYYVMIYLDRR